MGLLCAEWQRVDYVVFSRLVGTVAKILPFVLLKGFIFQRLCSP
ncbi:hypothetical protein ACZ87_02018, partial [Candidatus Erwinia dacicola]